MGFCECDGRGWGLWDALAGYAERTSAIVLWVALGMESGYTGDDWPVPWYGSWLGLGIQ